MFSALLNNFQRCSEQSKLCTTFSTCLEVSSLLPIFCQVWLWACSPHAVMLQGLYLPSLSLPVFLTGSSELYHIFQPEHLQLLSGKHQPDSIAVVPHIPNHRNTQHLRSRLQKDKSNSSAVHPTQFLLSFTVC